MELITVWNNYPVFVNKNPVYKNAYEKEIPTDKVITRGTMHIKQT